MIEDKKIEEAASVYGTSNGYSVVGPDGRMSLKPELENAFEAGAKWAINEFLKDLWHPASEIPCEGKYLVVEYNVTDTIKDYLSFKRLEGYLGWNWIPYCKCNSMALY